MKLRKLICGALVVGSMLSMVAGVSHAEYLTAYEDIKYEKYVVDTASFYYPDKNDKYNQFNCIVWRYTSDTDKGSPFTFRFKYVDNQWKVAERDKNNKLIWVKVENKSIAAGVLRATMPYLGKTNNVKKTEEPVNE